MIQWLVYKIIHTWYMAQVFKQAWRMQHISYSLWAFMIPSLLCSMELIYFSLFCLFAGITSLFFKWLQHLESVWISILHCLVIKKRLVGSSRCMSSGTLNLRTSTLWQNTCAVSALKKECNISCKVCHSAFQIYFSQFHQVWPLRWVLSFVFFDETCHVLYFKDGLW